MKYSEEMYLGSNIFDGDMDGSESNFSEKVVKIRKSHNCCVPKRDTKRNKNGYAKCNSTRYRLV